MRAAAVRAPLLAPDPGVPGRDVLLDAGQMTDRLSRLLGRDGPAGIDRYARGRAKYKVGESLRVVHEIEVDGAPWIVASRTFPDGRSERVYERALAETRENGGPLLGVAHDPELRAVFWTFPNDRKIATLPALLPATDTVSGLLGRPIARTVLAAYAPEKSATAACFDELLGRPVAYAKVFADPDELHASHRAHTAVFDGLGTSHSALRVPAVLASSEDDRMLIVEAIQGRSIDAMRGPEQLDGDAPVRRRAGGVPQPAGRGGPPALHPPGPRPPRPGRRAHRPRAARRRRRRGAPRGRARRRGARPRRDRRRPRRRPPQERAPPGTADRADRPRPGRARHAGHGPRQRARRPALPRARRRRGRARRARPRPRCSTATRRRASCPTAPTSTGTSPPPCSPSARCAP